MSDNNWTNVGSPYDTPFKIYISKTYRSLLNHCKYITNHKKTLTNMRCSNVIDLSKNYTENSILTYLETAPRIKTFFYTKMTPKK